MALVLCLDCGNTRLKWGLHDGQGWQARGALPWPELDQLETLVTAALAGRRLKGMLGCLVAAEIFRVQLENLARKLAVPLRWNASQRMQAGVSNAYLQPEQLGADRWAALIGAHQQQPASACLVVTAGTATTIDHLTTDGRFLGGVIMPGLDMMRLSLNQQTARLPLQAADFAERPKDTATAISSGCLQATVGAIERMFRSMATAEATAATAERLCLISGGAAPALLALLDIPWRHVENLALEGLAHIAASTSWHV